MTEQVADIIELANTVYTKEGVGLWLLGRNKLLNGKRPVDLIREGRLEELRNHIAAKAEGTFV